LDLVLSALMHHTHAHTEAQTHTLVLCSFSLTLFEFLSHSLLSAVEMKTKRDESAIS